jgi:hypothetical protein
VWSTPHAKAVERRTEAAATAAACGLNCWLNSSCLLDCAADNFNWCSVPLKGSDAFLFVSLALVTAAALFGKLSAVWVLISGVVTVKRGACSLVLHECMQRYMQGVRLLPLCAGGVIGAINNYANLLQVSNSISIWLGISPPDLFFYAVSLLKSCSGMQGLLAACRHIAGLAARNAAAAVAAVAAVVAAIPAGLLGPSACSVAPPVSAAVPAAIACGQRDSNRLLYVFKGALPFQLPACTAVRLHANSPLNALLCFASHSSSSSGCTFSRSRL